jgi:hypothetical protein
MMRNLRKISHGGKTFLKIFLKKVKPGLNPGQTRVNVESSEIVDAEEISKKRDFPEQGKSFWATLVVGEVPNVYHEWIYHCWAYCYRRLILGDSNTDKFLSNFLSYVLKVKVYEVDFCLDLLRSRLL